RVMPGNLTQLSHKCFEQAAEDNPLLGGIKRDYQELESDLTCNDDFKRLVLDFVKICEIDRNETEIGVHQIRIASTDKMPGRPTPEGVHVDGFDFVGVFCVGRNNIQGGETYLYRERGAESIYRRTLEPGEFLVFDDRKLLHYTSQIEALNSNCGTRDVFILTASVTNTQNEEERLDPFVSFSQAQDGNSTQEWQFDSLRDVLPVDVNQHRIVSRERENWQHER